MIQRIKFNPKEKKTFTEVNALFPKQVAMRAGSSQCQDKLVVRDFVDEKPIGPDVAFHERFPVSG